ncbi:MAG: AbrB/MazE/SpoVT family DNA-binding domain-containing protein [Candidatus Aenigmarchaeota archaeon]|nr:AbrB/MazE/SpoVT family DNA-binding domain-containing protein [Candidatus Aenigmarchaeota archaeon]
MKPEEMDMTVLSSKGQVVIPKDIRESLHIKEGSVLAITAYPEKDILVFKAMRKPDIKKDLALVRETERAWREIESGKFKKTSKEHFLENIRNW